MKKNNKKKVNTKLVGCVGLGLFVLGMILSAVGLSQAVNEIDNAVIAREPEAILASAGVKAGTDIDLPVTYYDQKADACANMYDLTASRAAASRQFEWSSCNYDVRRLEQGMVEYQLGADYLPVGVGGELLSNRGMNDLTRWFDNVEGKSKEYKDNLKLSYTVDDAVAFSYYNDNFYPLDSVEFSADDGVNSDGHNHLFTMGFGIPFTVMADGSEAFEIMADDDTFVYVGDRLALDMGGIHDAIKGRFVINENGEVYAGVGDEELAYSGISVVGGEGSIVRIFHADRDSASSVFNLKLTGFNMSVIGGQMASADGVQVAFDPSNPGYIAPLGESLVVRPDMTRAYIVIATVMGIMIVLCSVFAAVMVRAIAKNKKLI